MTTTDKPSIAELMRLHEAMDQPPWVDVHPAVVFQDGAEPLYIADCRGARPHENAAGIAALVNAAPVLLEIAAAGKAWATQRADNLQAALLRTEAELEAEAQDVGRARVKRTAELAAALEAALAKVTL